MTKKTPAKKTSKKAAIKKAPAKKVVTKKVKPAKKVAKKVAKKLVKKVAKKAAKKPVAKKAAKKPVAKKTSKKVAKKSTKQALAKVRSDYSNITFEQPVQDNIIVQHPTELSTTNTQADFATQIRDNARKANQGKPKVHMKCRRGFDKATHGQTCKSMQAYKMSPDGSNQVMFTCVDCGFSWSVSIGGSINI